MGLITRRQFAAAATLSTAALSVHSPLAASAPTSRLADLGWCWDGQGFCAGTPPSIFGIGAGTTWFGLRRTCFMFHPNNDIALEHLQGFEQVVCEISKWKVRRAGDPQDCGVVHYLDSAIETKLAEAKAVNALASRFSNIRGAIDDDLGGVVRRKIASPDSYANVYAALRQGKPQMRLWTVVYSTELNRENWQGFTEFMDVVHLCVHGQVQNFGNIERYLDQSAELFPRKPVNLVYRLTDFTPPGPIPLEHLKSHWQTILGLVERRRIEGFAILGGFLIDSFPDQARWLRDFIKAN